MANTCVFNVCMLKCVTNINSLILHNNLVVRQGLQLWMFNQKYRNKYLLNKKTSPYEAYGLINGDSYQRITRVTLYMLHEAEPAPELALGVGELHPRKERMFEL